MLDSNVIIMSVIIVGTDENVDIRLRIMCPAVIFAANRKLSVKGRTITLIDSMITRNGFSQSGALLGSR